MTLDVQLELKLELELEHFYNTSKEINNIENFHTYTSWNHHVMSFSNLDAAPLSLVS